MKKLFAMGAILLLLSLILSACYGDGSSTATSGTGTDALKYCNPTTSLACKEIQARYKLFTNSDQYGYFYGFIQGDPEPVIVYVTQGGVFPLDDMVTPPDKNVPCNTNGTGACAVVQQNQQPDGTWGSNGQDGWFGFRADGQYFEWIGMPHAFSFQPLPFRPPHVIGCPKSNAPTICQ